ncbi:STAS domain-containing protein [Stenotrophomonas sp. GbtcB23]|uniref:STAS domain-containing protein n=1 Tax=Stenotrophomonas sp. GbtcB23 TaxID=2824768 RepID=UPI001C2F6CB2|nr:STAS domain-containing protein [Stenotrophomonas sp. GbtcB23]
MASNATVQLDGPRARFTGVLDRDAVVALWPQLKALPDRISQLDLAAVEGVDSAGLALLAELSARARANGRTLVLNGTPPGFTELSAAYRLAPSLDFNAPSAAS